MGMMMAMMSQSLASHAMEVAHAQIVMVVDNMLILVMVDVEFVEVLVVVQAVMEKEYIKYMIKR